MPALPAQLFKTARIALFSVLLLVVLASIGIGWLCYTASGLQFALLQLNRVPGLQVRIEGVSGQLAGPLHVDHIVLDHERVHIDIKTLDVDLTPAYLLSGLIDINQLKVGDISAQLKPPTSAATDKPIHFLPAFLRISIDALQLQRAQYRHTNGYEIIAQPLLARVDLSSSRLRIRDLNAATRDFDARGTATLDTATRDTVAMLSLLADLDADYRIVNGPVLRGHLKARGPLTGNERALNVDALLREPHQAHIDAVLAFPDSGWQLRGNARAEHVLLNAWWPEPTFSLARLAMQFELSNAGMHYLGDAIVPEWSPLPLHIDAHTRYAERVFTVQRADISMPKSGVRTSTQGSITLRTGSKPLVALNSSWSYLQWPLHAQKSTAWFTSNQGTFSINGTQPYAFTLDARVATPQWPETVAQANGEIRPGEIQIANYELQTLQGKASGNATLALGTPRRWQLAMRATDINPALLADAWPGKLNFQASASGSGFDRQAAFDLRLAALTGTLRNQALNAKGRVQHEFERGRDHWLAESVSAQWGRAQLSAQGNVSLANGELAGDSAQNNLQWTLAAPVLKQLHPDLDGDVNMKGAFSGTTKTPLLTLTAQSTRFSYGSWQARAVQLDTHLDVTDRSASQLDLRAQSLAQGDLALNQVHLTGAGQTSAHTLTLQATPVQSLLPKDLQLKLQVKGGYADSVWKGALDDIQVTDAQATTRVKLQASAPVLLSSRQAQLQALCLTVDQGQLCANGDWSVQAAQAATWNLHTELQDLPLTVGNAAFTNDARLVARVTGDVNFAARPGFAWQGRGDLRFDDASIRYQLATGRERSLPISLAELHLDANAQTVNTNAELRLGEQTVATLNATLNRSLTSDMQSWPLSGVLAFSSSDAKLIPVFINEVDRAAGTLAAVLQLSGTAAAPRFAGNVRLLQGELDFYQLNLALRALELDAQVDTDHLRFTAQGNAGEGPLQASGDLSWQSNKLLGNLQLKGERLLVADLPEYRVLASPDLRFEIDDHRVEVKGDVLIPEARLQPKDVVGAVQTSADARFKTDQLLQSKTSNWQINSDINIRLGEAVNFDGLGLQGQLNGAVGTRLRTGEVALGTGELSISNGRYEAYAQKLDIKRGRLIYDNTPLADPGLDIQAERKVNDINVGVNVRGVLRAPRLQFYSDPTMSQTQIVSYLLVGKPLDELQGQEATTVRSASNTLAIQGGGYLAAQLGRRIGLEQVGVETDANNQSALVLGKFLSPRLFISYGISLTEAINTLKLRYTLSDHWTLKTEAGEAKGADIEFKIER